MFNGIHYAFELSFEDAAAVGTDKTFSSHFLYLILLSSQELLEVMTPMGTK